MLNSLFHDKIRVDTYELYHEATHNYGYEKKKVYLSGAFAMCSRKASHSSSSFESLPFPVEAKLYCVV